MHRYSTHSVDAIFALMEPGAEPATTADGFRLKVKSDRLILFKLKGLACVTCGLTGSFFALETHRGERPHLNLYAMKRGRAVLMTKDHIVPKARGGLNVMANYQPMCVDCNGKKADRL